MQEAYRPWRIKYYRGGVVPPVGVPSQPGLMGGTQSGVFPSRGTPWPGLRAGYLRWGSPCCWGTPQLRYPRPGPMGGVPEVGYPPGWTWLGYLPQPGPGRGTPPGVDRQMDRHESKHNLPVVLRTRSVKITLRGNTEHGPCPYPSWGQGEVWGGRVTWIRYPPPSPFSSPRHSHQTRPNRGRGDRIQTGPGQDLPRQNLDRM